VRACRGALPRRSSGARFARRRAAAVDQKRSITIPQRRRDPLSVGAILSPTTSIINILIRDAAECYLPLRRTLEWLLHHLMREGEPRRTDRPKVCVAQVSVPWTVPLMQARPTFALSSAQRVGGRNPFAEQNGRTNLMVYVRSRARSTRLSRGLREQPVLEPIWSFTRSLQNRSRAGSKPCPAKLPACNLAIHRGHQRTGLHNR
jgi:hypothetical protein